MYNNYYWDTKIEYLKNSRILFFNDSYFEYLVKYVWKIDKPVRLLDFGCGTGYLGSKLMPLLPEGSSYIGIDRGEKLLEECRNLFANFPYESEFYNEDITNMDTSKYEGDITICQAVLQHMKSPKEVLKTMKECTKEDGLVVSINPMWTSSMANYYVHEIAPLDTVDLGILQKLYEFYASNGETNGQLAIRVPVMMSDIGLTDVECRMSDKVNYIHPELDSEQHKKLYDALMAEGFGGISDDREKAVKRLATKGISIEEAEKVLDIEHNLYKILKEQRESLHILWSPSFMVSFGKVLAKPLQLVW